MRKRAGAADRGGARGWVGAAGAALLVVLGGVALLVAAPLAGGPAPATRLAAASPGPVVLTTPAPAADGAGMSRAAPVRFGQEAQAGPLAIRVVDAQAGPSAVEQTLAASPLNEAPPAGSTLLLVRIAARNTGDAPVPIAAEDFAATGASGVVGRFLVASPPDPVLRATLGPGEATEGWAVFAVPEGEGELLLLFDSLALSGNWADRVFAIESGAAIPDAPAPVAAPNAVGADPAAPAGIGAAIVTDDWSVELLEVVSGEAVFGLVDYRTGALGVEDASGADGSVWVALRLRIANVRAGGQAGHLPANAFALADAAGEPLLDIATLTPPRPDATGDYFPGGAREGWVAFDVPLEAGAAVVRFLPYPGTVEAPDPRYLVLD